MSTWRKPGEVTCRRTGVPKLLDERLIATGAPTSSLAGKDP
jgi:hypothetical protein